MQAGWHAAVACQLAALALAAGICCVRAGRECVGRSSVDPLMPLPWLPSCPPAEPRQWWEHQHSRGGPLHTACVTCRWPAGLLLTPLPAWPALPRAASACRHLRPVAQPCPGCPVAHQRCLAFRSSHAVQLRGWPRLHAGVQRRDAGGPGCHLGLRRLPLAHHPRRPGLPGRLRLLRPLPRAAQPQREWAGVLHARDQAVRHIRGAGVWACRRGWQQEQPRPLVLAVLLLGTFPSPHRACPPAGCRLRTPRTSARSGLTAPRTARAGCSPTPRAATRHPLR